MCLLISPSMHHLKKIRKSLNKHNLTPSQPSQLPQSGFSLDSQYVERMQCPGRKAPPESITKHLKFQFKNRVCNTLSKRIFFSRIPPLMSSLVAPPWSSVYGPSLTEMKLLLWTFTCCSICTKLIFCWPNTFFLRLFLETEITVCKNTILLCFCDACEITVYSCL